MAGGWPASANKENIRSITSVYSQHPAWVMAVFKLFKWPPFSTKCGRPDPRPSAWELFSQCQITSDTGFMRRAILKHLTHIRHPQSPLSWVSSVVPWLTSWPGSQIKTSEAKHRSVSEQILQTIFREMLLRAFHSFTTWHQRRGLSQYPVIWSNHRHASQVRCAMQCSVWWQ